MTTDEIIDLAHKAGTPAITRYGLAVVTIKWMESFAALVAAAEREACAKVCEGGSFLHDDAPDARFGKACAAAIRARSNT